MITEIYDYVMMGLVSNGYFVTDAPCLNGGHGYDFASSVGHSRSNSVGLLVYDGIHTISGVLVLYYKSLETTPTLSGMS
jgi:hypothetical protein